MGKKILILEDEKEVGQIYLKSLKDRGYEPVWAGDGVEGVNQLKAGFAPDLILLDLGMPKMNGLEFYQYICDSKGKPKYSVLVLTGRGDLGSVMKDFEVEGFIIKPFSREQLLSEIETVLTKQYKREQVENAKRVVIVEENAAAAEQMKQLLAAGGYKVEIVNSGTLGMENILIDPPDVAVVNLSLSDYAGDMVILRLQGMAKTRHVKYILYVEKKYTLNRTVMENLSQKSGVKLMCEYDKPAEILEAIGDMLKEPPPE